MVLNYRSCLITPSILPTLKGRLFEQLPQSTTCPYLIFIPDSLDVPQIVVLHDTGRYRPTTKMGQKKNIGDVE